MALDESFKRPGTIPFKWELQPGVPKQQQQQQPSPRHHGEGSGGATTGSSSTSSPAPASLLLPPRLALPPRAHDTGRASSLASTAPSPSPRSSHRRSMSARFTASLVLPFTRPRRGRSRDEADITFTVLYGDKIA
ncbi:protein alan shepard-like [Oryza brachyantha]|uniref:Uncharacterized protein n=1 Tax=Oryza brachyantha TaxID=4533 RepID=J3LUM1_ORYBR|nr:protein alan shepard-like [Oryza brachyantha]